MYINWPYAKVPESLGLSLWLKNGEGKKEPEGHSNKLHSALEIQGGPGPDCKEGIFER